MEIACIENVAVLHAEKDMNIFRDNRVIPSLKQRELCYLPQCNYFELQDDIQPYMRKVVTMWMLEVCEEQKCEDAVLPLAVNFMDRFLSVCIIKRQQLQLLGATCLLIASKMRSANRIGIELLCTYTDNSVSYEHIFNWELLVLSKLQWNLCAITGYDYVDQIIERCPWGNESSLLRRHSNTLVSICYTEPTLIQTAPSLIASACICSAIRGLKLPSSANATRDICTMMDVDPIALELLVRFIDHTIEKVMPPTPEKTQPAPSKYLPEQYEASEYNQPGTPTDVDNAYFCDD